MTFNNIHIVYNNRIYNDSDYQSFLKLHYRSIDGYSRVILLMNRTPDLIFSMMMMLEKQITYIPVDTLYPAYRIKYIIDNSCADAIFSDIEHSYKTGDLPYEKGNIPEGSNEIANIMYTSGSTGNPKGVEITREALTNFIDSISEFVDFSTGKSIVCLAAASFDIFFLESILAILKGMTVVLANEGEQQNPKLITGLIVSHHVDMVQITPSRLQQLFNYDRALACLKEVKEILVGGEPFPLNLLFELQSKTNAKIYNLYGPTETTLWTTVSDLTVKDIVDIGRPIKNTQIYIVDESLKILTVDQPGELCITGKGLGKGYVNQEALTNEKFVVLPEKPETLVFRTGDIGKYLPDGNLCYIGRKDNQIKIRGHRVELGEIESVINAFPGIRESIVIAFEINEVQKLLVAFYTCNLNIDHRMLNDHLASRLPDFMIPNEYIQIEEFNLTPNGKIDRNGLYHIAEKYFRSEQKISCETISETHEKVLQIINTSLDRENSSHLSIDMNLSEAGIDSIVLIQIIINLEEFFKMEFEDEYLVRSAFKNIKSIADYIELKK